MKRDRNDESKLISFYPESKPNFSFAFKSYARVFSPTFIPEKEGGEWQAYLTLLKVRHRLTHPKDFDSQIVSADECSSAVIVDGWFTK